MSADRLPFPTKADSVLDAFESASAVGLGFVDRQFQIIRINSALASMSGMSAEELLGRAVSEIVPELWPQLEPMYRRVIDHAETVANIEIVGHTAADPSRTHHWLTNFYPVRYLGEVIGVGVMAIDVSDRKQLEAQLQRQTLHDPLTGLPNRALFVERAQYLLDRGAREHLPVSVILVDLDNFKVVNDALGHAAGDDLLVAVAQRLSNALRSADTVYRFGGDEFVILADPRALDAPPEMMAERVREVLQPSFQVNGEEISVTASIGIASGDNTVHELIRDADIAMYQAKAEGKNATVTFVPTMQTLARERLQLEIDLRRAIERGEFDVVYQPIVDLERDAVVGTEALVRWNHPARGLLEPSEFLPLAEENGMILEIGRLVLAEACAVQARRKGAGAVTSLAVNLSTRQVESLSLIDDVRDILAQTGIEPGQLVFEITESTLMRDTDGVIDRLNALKELGAQLAIDDFGTGYCSLSYLRQFPVDILKIDRSFISGLEGSHEQSAIVHSLTELGRALNLDIIAEGIETKEQLEVLREHGCSIGQGFFFAPPLHPAQLEQFLEAWERRDGPGDPRWESPPQERSGRWLHRADDLSIAAVNRAISQRLVKTIFQPLVHLATADVVGYEALSRGPTGSPVESPIELLHAARSAGRLSELDWLCASIAYDAAVAAGLHPSMSVFLNFEPSTLLSPCPPELLSAARRVLDRLRVFVEVKEEMLLADPGGLFDALAHVREIGWGVALDNVAATPTALALMPLIHPDVIKLDLRRLQGNPDAIAQMSDGARLYAEQTGATVLAEGIEDVEGVLQARALGAHYGQGWHFGEPASLPAGHSVPRAVFPLLAKPEMNGWQTPFEIVSARCEATITEKRFLASLSKYLQAQAGTNGPPGLLLTSYPRNVAVGSEERNHLREAIERAAFAVALGPGLRTLSGPNIRVHEIHPDDPIGGEWNLIVLGPHYASAIVARGLGDTCDEEYRRFEYVVTHDRELVLMAARGVLRRVNSSEIELSHAVGGSR